MRSMDPPKLAVGKRALDKLGTSPVVARRLMRQVADLYKSSRATGAGQRGETGLAGQPTIASPDAAVLASREWNSPG